MARFRVSVIVELDGTDGDDAAGLVVQAIDDAADNANVTVSKVDTIKTRHCDNCFRDVDASETDGCPFCGIAWDQE